MKKYIVLAIIFLVACNKETPEVKLLEDKIDLSGKLKRTSGKVVGEPTMPLYRYEYDSINGNLKYVYMYDTLLLFSLEYHLGYIELKENNSSMKYRAYIDNENNIEKIQEYDTSLLIFNDKLILYKDNDLIERISQIGANIFLESSKNSGYIYTNGNCIQYVNEYRSRPVVFANFADQIDTIHMTYYNDLLNDKYMFQSYFGATAISPTGLELDNTVAFSDILMYSGFKPYYINKNLIKSLNDYTFKYYINTKNQIKRMDLYYPDSSTKVSSTYYEYY
jgi:hypothetical protein